MNFSKTPSFPSTAYRKTHERSPSKGEEKKYWGKFPQVSPLPYYSGEKGILPVCRLFFFPQSQIDTVSSPQFPVSHHNGEMEGGGRPPACLSLEFSSASAASSEAKLLCAHNELRLTQLAWLSPVRSFTPFSPIAQASAYSLARLRCIHNSARREAELSKGVSLCSPSLASLAGLRNRVKAAATAFLCSEALLI